MAISNDSYVLAIGGSNVDIQGNSYSSLIPQDSNPGSVKFSFGGVAKNIIDNVARLDLNTKFISIFGDDIFASEFTKYLKDLNININDSMFLEKQNSSIYLSILNNTGEMELAISSMDILKHLTPKFLEKKKEIIKSSKILIIDTNLEKDTIDYLTGFSKDTKIIVDTVSTSKAIKIKDSIGKFHTVKPNKIEAEILSGIKITKNEDLKKCASFFLDKGVKNVFISLGKDGVFFMNENDCNSISIPKVSIKNVTGAGDSFVAGIVYGEYNNLDIMTSTKYGIAASLITINDTNTVSDNMNVSNIKRILEENNI